MRAVQFGGRPATLPPHLSLPLEKKHVRVLLILKEAPTLEKLLEPPVNSTALYLQARPG